MNEIVTVKVNGLQEINRALQDLPFRIANKVLKKGVAAGAALLRDAIRKAAPVRKTGGEMKVSNSRGSGSAMRSPGFLRKNIKSLYRRKASGPGNVHYAIGPMGDAYYGYFVEKGHVIGKRKRYGRGIAEYNAGLKTVPAHPFMMPVFNSQTNQIIEKMKDKLSEGIRKEGRDLGLNMK